MAWAYSNRLPLPMCRAADPDLIKHWKIIEENLLNARRLLPDEVATGELGEFAMYIDHNELELAMDELDRIGQCQI
ncbi:hypothetical protein MFFC18_01010 [Mariniblastus fucicola]|uniref:Uncharacterized protein n=1 Tax=Mariniblastus fucicola TaxID=980251 RepID=A0A5B9P1W9_9BACT|nr:hypothetical protein MFFC18_01010 [Mariniblastus fucicola]